MNPMDFAAHPGRTCADEDTELFFSDSAATTADAVAICRACPVLDPCRRWAIDSGQWGVWGASTDAERRAIRKADQAARDLQFRKLLEVAA